MNIKRVIVITGGARGIGRSMVEHFLASSQHSAVSTCDILDMEHDNDGTISGRLLTQKCDVSDEAQVRAFVEETVHRFGRIDCLINNAGVASAFLHYDRFEHLDVQEFQRVLQINLVGPTLLMKYCVPHLRQTRGSIINISSTRAKMSEPKSEAYAASKGGLESLTHAAAMSLASDKIRVNAIAPGWIFHPAQVGLYEPTQADHDFHPVGRIGCVQDMCAACEFLADSTKSGFMTGQTITLDGGVTRKMIYAE